MKLPSKACLVLLIISLIIPGAAVAGQGAAEKIDPGKPLSEFTLTDHMGSSFTKNNLTDKWSLILLGFTHCPDICPYTLQNLTLVLQEMSMRVRPENLPQVVFIAVDPARDRAILKDYVEAFSDDYIGATGDWEEIEKVVESVNGFVRVEEEAYARNDYQVYHSAFVAVVDPQGNLVAHLNPPMNPSASTVFLTNLMREHARQIN
ncbi:MAG: SCO family protein [Hyphomicrobiales bacterium]|nr:SCO family protein [Hyphomicrobiales bacterium]